MASLASELVITLVDRVSGPAGKIKTSIAGLDKTTADGFGKGIDASVRKLDVFGSKLQATGGKLAVGLTVPIVAAAGKALPMLVELDRKINDLRFSSLAEGAGDVAANIAQASDKAERLFDIVTRISREMGVSQSTLTGTAAIYAKKGITDADRLGAYLRTTSLLRMTDSSIDDVGASRILVALRETMGLDKLAAADEARRIQLEANRIAVASKHSGFSAGELVQVLQVAGPGMLAGGVQLKDILSEAAAMAQGGIDPSMIPVSMRSIDVSLRNPKKKGKAALKKMGLDLGQYMNMINGEAAGWKDGGMFAFFDDVNKYVQRTGDTSVFTPLVTGQQSSAFAAMMAAWGTAQMLRLMLADGNVAIFDQGIFGVRDGSSSGKMNRLGASWERMQVKVFRGPGLMIAVDALRMLLDTIDLIPAGILQPLVAGLALIGPAMLAAGTGLRLLSSAGIAFGMPSLAAPMAGAAAGGATLLGILGRLTIVGAAAGAAIALWPLLAGIDWSAMATGLGAMGPVLWNMAKGAGGAIGAFASDAWSIATGVMPGLSSVAEQAFATAKAWAGSVWSLATGLMPGLDSIAEIAKSAWNQTWQAIFGGGDDGTTPVEARARKAQSWLDQLGGAAIGAIQPVAPDLAKSLDTMGKRETGFLALAAAVPAALLLWKGLRFVRGGLFGVASLLPALGRSLGLFGAKTKSMGAESKAFFSASHGDVAKYAELSLAGMLAFTSVGTVAKLAAFKGLFTALRYGAIGAGAYGLYSIATNFGAFSTALERVGKSKAVSALGASFSELGNTVGQLASKLSGGAVSADTFEAAMLGLVNTATAMVKGLDGLLKSFDSSGVITQLGRIGSEIAGIGTEAFNMLGTLLQIPSALIAAFGVSGEGSETLRWLRALLDVIENILRTVRLTAESFNTLMNNATPSDELKSSPIFQGLQDLSQDGGLVGRATKATKDMPTSYVADWLSPRDPFAPSWLDGVLGRRQADQPHRGSNRWIGASASPEDMPLPAVLPRLGGNHNVLDPSSVHLRGGNLGADLAAAGATQFEQFWTRQKAAAAELPGVVGGAMQAVQQAVNVDLAAQGQAAVESYAAGMRAGIPAVMAAARSASSAARIAGGGGGGGYAAAERAAFSDAGRR